MKRALPIIFVVVLLVLGIWVWRVKSKSEAEAKRDFSPPVETVATGVSVTTISIPSSRNGSQAAPLLGETILRDYANTNLPPQNDLTLISRLMDNFTLLVKSAADRPLSANEDWAAAFRGLNPAHERFLPDQHAALNPQGQLVDRWKTPLFFHALGGRRFELRSAGPDKKLWTDDDIHRNADGSFRRGAELNPASLLNAATRGRPPTTAP